MTLLVFEDGTVAVDEQATQAPIDAVTVDNGKATAMVAVEDTAIDLTFQKADAKGTALGGAEFRITGVFADGSTEHEVVSAADGSLEVPQLVAGEKYAIEEISAPEGYQLIDGAFEFAVTEDGVIEAESTSVQNILFGTWSAGYVVADDGLTLTAEQLAQAPHLTERVRNKLLAAKAGVDGHEHHHVELGRNLLQAGHGRVRIERYAGQHAGLPDLLHHAVQVGAGLVMHVHHPRAQGGHAVNVLLRLHNHQMHVERLARTPRHGLHHRKTE